MNYSDYFDPDKLFEKIIEMKPEECKAAMIGGIFGFGLACEMLEDRRQKEKKPRRTDYTPYTLLTGKDQTRQNFRKIRLEFQDRDDAMAVREDLCEMLETSPTKYVTVRDLYSLADLPTSHEMLNWVWYDLEDCRIERSGDNYILRMPPAESIKREQNLK